jgi:hypothetical protein
LVDTLAMRQLPTLWLMVTLVRDVAIGNPVEVVLRPRVSDIVSSGSRLPYEHAPPAGWPADCRIATRGPAAPPYHALADVLPTLHERRTKALLVAPGGVRLVCALAHGDISRYRVVRRAKFDPRLEREPLEHLIGVTRAVARDVDFAAELETLTAR